MMFIVISAGMWEILALDGCMRRMCAGIRSRTDGCELNISYQAH
jgi:hypothetical protein